VSDLVDKYYTFAETMPQDMRAQYFENYKMICRKCFYPIAQSMLGNAQIFDDIPLGNARNLLEDSYKKQADNIRKSSMSLYKIVKFFEEVVTEDSMKDSGFTSMLVLHYMVLLEKIDALFNLETPYSVGTSVFDHWNGDRNPNFLNISQDQALKKYMLSQFNRLKFLAKDLAAPIVELLSMPVFASHLRDQTLLDKWREIISNIDDYEAQKPGNSIAALESFLSETLKKISINSFDSEGEIKAISENGGDFFTEKRAEVAKALINRADLIQYDKAAAAYKEIQAFFNTNLAHKFPFGDYDAEALVTDIEKFINIYDQQAINISPVLKSNAEEKQINPQVFEFLESLSKLVPFLRNWIEHTKNSDLQSPGVLFTIVLRPSPESEALTSSVLDRSFKLKNVAVADNGNAIFFNNDTIDVQFTWINGADERLNTQDPPRNLTIEKQKATFSYAGKWAMFRLIENHKINKEVEYPNGVLLQFEIPILNRNNETQTSKMVMKITPQMKVGDKLSPALWPIFPAVCPPLHIGENLPENLVTATGGSNTEKTPSTVLAASGGGVIEQELEKAADEKSAVAATSSEEADDEEEDDDDEEEEE
ncbi:MAG: hypothetical protein IJ730_06140, partial [Alphaproteobacteria bacterium]|nr:hypothetical protein [Alphaproteobacteria bacterium]